MLVYLELDNKDVVEIQKIFEVMQRNRERSRRTHEAKYEAEGKVKKVTKPTKAFPILNPLTRDEMIRHLSVQEQRPASPNLQ